MWSRVDDNIPHHPKFLKAGPLASWLWICGNCYCNRYLTDGFIPHEVLQTLGDIKSPVKQATRLVLAGLWEAADGGYRVHDFHDHNPKSADVKAKREADRIRKESGRNPRGIQEESEKNPSFPARAIPIPSQSHPILNTKNKLDRKTVVVTKANGNGHNARSKHPIFAGQRFVIFDWMLEDIGRTLGRHLDTFDIHEWFFSLDARAVKDSLVKAKNDWWPWIQQELIAEAQQRGLPTTEPKKFGVTPKTAGNAAALQRFVDKHQ